MPNQNPAYDTFAVDTDALPWETLPQTISAVLDGTWGALDGQMAATVSTTVTATLSAVWGSLDGQIVATVIPKVEAVLNGAWGALTAAMSATVIPPVSATMAGVWGALVGQMFATPVTPAFTGLQWQMNDGSGWVDIPGETSLSLSVVGYEGGTCFRIVETYDTDGCYDQVTSGILCLDIEVTPPECLQFFYGTGEDVEFEVPAGITSIDAMCWGGGYWGGQTFGTIPVTPGEILRFRVGIAATGQAGAYPNGGNGGNGPTVLGGGGSGGTDIFRGSTPLMVAGGEGGGNASTLMSSASSTRGGCGHSGGSGSTSTVGTIGIPTTPNGRPYDSSSTSGKGGTQTSGGLIGAGGTTPATAGSLDQGGNGSSHTQAGSTTGGGGGGGYFGGGGGGRSSISGFSWGGGGGSCYVDASVTGEFYMHRNFLYLAPCVDGSDGTAVPIITSEDDPTMLGTMLHCDVVAAAAADGLIALRLC